MNRSTQATVELIVTSARHALISHGYAKFTTQRVTEFAGISPGNLDGQTGESNPIFCSG